MAHDPDCTCWSGQKKSATRRQFLCMAVGGALGAVGAASAAYASPFNKLLPPQQKALVTPSINPVADVHSNISSQFLPDDHGSSENLIITLPKYPDMHSHLRQGEALPVFVERHLAMGSDIVLAMPNTAPPVSRVTGEPTEKSWSIESYTRTIRQAGGHRLRDIIVPLYLTADTTAEMIDAGAKSGLLRAVKYYPPNGTTNAGSGLSLDSVIGGDVLRAMEANDIVFCLHGEQHGLAPEDYFDRHKNAETIFYREKMPRLVDTYPNLRISCEHVTTEEAVKFVQQNDDRVVGTITPQHLLYTVGHLLQTWHADLFCRPLVKFESDRAALLMAVTDPKNNKFIAGTDSAPHPRFAKSTPCGCAAGSYVGGIAPQLYAQAFESAGVDFKSPQAQNIFRAFMAENAWRFWRLVPSQETIRLVKKPSEVGLIALPDGQKVEPLPVAMMGSSCDAQSAILPWSLDMG